MNYYSRYYRTVTDGYFAKPRGLETTYLHNQVFYAESYIMWRRPHDNIMIGIMEGLQFMAGVFDIEQIKRVAPNAKLELFTGQSSYGPRCGTQVEEIVELLRKDKYTRQAVLLLSDPKEPFAERPCTTSLQFQVNRFHSLTVTIDMRSSDAVWGLPYDIVQFNFMAHMVSACVGLPLRSLVINLANAHVYKSTALERPTFTQYSFSLPAILNQVDEWKEWALNLIPIIDASSAKDLFHIQET